VHRQKDGVAPAYARQVDMGSAQLYTPQEGGGLQWQSAGHSAVVNNAFRLGFTWLNSVNIIIPHVFCTTVPAGC
jgi:hypothetical protein